jgi:hypothetical protein
MKKRWLIALAVLVIIGLVVLGFIFKDKLFKEKAETIEDKNSETGSALKLARWDHMPITYSLDENACGTYESRRIARAFEEINNASNGKITFKKLNVTENIADLNINCSFIENCYKYLQDIVDYGGYTYEYEYEYTCSYNKALISKEEEGKPKSISINFIGLGGFYEEKQNPTLMSGFAVGDCGYPIPEIREILKAVLGYGQGYYPSVRPAIYSYDYDIKDYSIMNSFQVFSGLDTYLIGACNKTLKNIDSWIKQDLQNYNSNEELNKNYVEECKNLPTLDRKEWCQINIANSTGNEKYCDVIKDPFKKDGCYQIVAFNKKYSSICYNIADEGIKDSCFYNLASKNKNLEACSGINNITRKEWCYQNVSIVLGNYSKCADIADYDRKNWCYEALAQKSKEDALCYEQNMGLTGICVALANNSKDLCYIDGTYNHECIIRLAEFNKNPEICYSIQEQDYWSKEDRNIYCIENVAIITRNASVCNYIKNIGDDIDKRIDLHKSVCFWSLAYELENPDTCSEITDSWYKDNCYWDVAKITNKESVCSRISNAQWADLCLRDIRNMNML